MQKILFLLFSLAFSGYSFSQEHNANFKLDPKMKKAPSGFVWVKENLAAYQSEITVDSYLAFLEAVSIDSSVQYVNSLLPSTECALYPFVEPQNIGKEIGKSGSGDPPFRLISWIDEEKFKSANNYPPKEKIPGISFFYLNPYNKPITGITFEQANEFAKWCTSNVYKDIKPSVKKNLTKAIVFRLPSIDEVNEMGKKGIENCQNKDQKICEKNIKNLKECKNEKGCALCNCAGKDTCSSNKTMIAAFGLEALYAALSFNPNWIGLFNMQGNAAEMTSEKGIAKGGSYFQLAKDCLPEAVQNYASPQKWLGFRLVAEVINVDGKNTYFDEEGRLIIIKSQ